MKIGILTLPLHTNYGGILQAYALLTTLKNMGYDPYLISLKAIKYKKSIKEILKFGLLKFIHNVNTNIVSLAQCREISAKKINYFISENIDKILYPTSYEELKFLDAIIVGSDQVWRKEYSSDVRIYFLNFTKGWNIKRIAYAASFGSDDWTYSPVLSAECGSLLNVFNGISVRENSAVQLCAEHFGVNAVCVMDPTLLLDMNDYVFQVKEGDIILTYILDASKEKSQMISAIESHFKVCTVSNIDFEYYGHNISKVNVLKGVDEWLENFARAKFVFTDSFHGCVFCIIFNKPFAVVLNSKRGNSRFYSLLSKFGLMDRIVNNESEVVSLLSKNIDWNNVNRTRDSLKKESYSFLMSNLKQS